MLIQQYYPPMKHRITPEWPRVLLEPSRITVWLEDGRERSIEQTETEYHGWFRELTYNPLDDESRDHSLDDLVEWVCEAHKGGK